MNYAFDMRQHREEMMRTFWPVDLRTGTPLTEEQAKQLFARQSPRDFATEERFERRQDALLAWIRRPKTREEPTMRTGFFRESSVGGRYVGSGNVNFRTQPTHWRALPSFWK
jgi:hypothetical protein